jgi:hypothetical protein
MARPYIATLEMVDTLIKSPDPGHPWGQTVFYAATMWLRDGYGDFAVEFQPDEAADFANTYYEWRTPDDLGACPSNAKIGLQAQHAVLLR